ncbi:MAG: phosphatidate cytidylyltransferase [Chloroflexi bacterium]|mgnify:CR=1 FL=1|jgi:phosphatidate cytidylyltransferase|nr:phosphatidate cytidylyltransferase [Chloroflexota bacterium]
MLRARVISALVLIPILICTIWFAPYWLYAALFGAVILLGVYEFYKVVRSIGVHPYVTVGLIITALFVFYAYFSSHPSLTTFPNILPSLGAVVALTGYFAYYLHRFTKRPGAITVAKWLWTVAGVIYVGWLGSHFIALRGVGGVDGWDVGRRWIIIALFATFAADTFAYMIGRLWGRHKMAPRISPGKTWEGAAGGFAGGLGATVLLAYILSISVTWQLILLGCLIPVFAILGDLTESKFKRSTGVKDAGSIIPGHGGILDRLDSILFVVVVVYYYVLWVI